MTDWREALRAHLVARHAETWPFLQALVDADAGVPVYSEENSTWTVQQVVAHMADAERGLLGQARRLRAGEETVPADFDLNRWNRGVVRRRASLSVSALLQEILQGHAEVLAFVETMEDIHRDLSGRHSSGKVMNMEEFLRRIGDHRAEHTADLRAALKK